MSSYPIPEIKTLVVDLTNGKQLYAMTKNGFEVKIEKPSFNLFLAEQNPPVIWRKGNKVLAAV